jgi:hypothetical protein
MNENKIINFVLEKSRKFIKDSFVKKDKCNKSINYVTETWGITVHRNCYHSQGQNGSYSYYEDYIVHFCGIINNKKIKSSFFMEWENNDMDGILVPANTRWNPITEEFSGRNIKIKYVT